MKILVDMNLPPVWVAEFAANGIDAVHWSDVGDPRAPDTQVMAYAREHGCVVFTHDLDFGVLLALTRASGPSVLQLRAQNVLPEDVREVVLDVLRNYGTALDTGALISVDMVSARVRILPLV